MYQKCFDCEPYKTQNLLNKKQHLLKSVNTNFTLAVHSPKLNLSADFLANSSHITESAVISGSCVSTPLTHSHLETIT